MARISNTIPNPNLHIYEGSLKRDWNILDELKDRFNANVVLVYGLKFGAVRNLALKSCKNDYVAMIDDDIVLGCGWFRRVFSRFKENDVVASQGKIIYGSNGSVVNKLSKASLRDSGGSGGASIYDRKQILSLGNFNKEIHRGEDLELKLRINNSGFKWAQNINAVVYHPISDIKSFLWRAKVDVSGYKFVLKHSKNRTRFFIERLGALLIMPTYYLWRTRDLRCFGVWGLFRFLGLWYFLTNNCEDWKKC